MGGALDKSIGPSCFLSCVRWSKGLVLSDLGSLSLLCFPILCVLERKGPPLITDRAADYCVVWIRLVLRLSFVVEWHREAMSLPCLCGVLVQDRKGGARPGRVLAQSLDSHGASCCMSSWCRFSVLEQSALIRRYSGFVLVGLKLRGYCV